MSTPFNDQWILRRATRKPAHARPRSNERRDGTALAPQPVRAHVAGRLVKRPRWIDRDI